MIEPTGLHASIWSFLVENFAGLEKAAPRAAILQRFNLINHKEITDREFRTVISELIIIFKKSDLHGAVDRLLPGLRRARKTSLAELSRLGLKRGQRPAPQSR